MTEAGWRRRRLLDWLLLLLVFGLLALRVYVYQPVQVIQQSMEPTLSPGDQLLINRLVTQRRLPERGSIVVVDVEGEDELLVKRVVGVAGDELRLGRRGLRVNGRWIREDYIHPYPEETPVTVTVPPDSIWVLGDNRPYSNDSRDFGPVPRERIVGQAVVVLAPKEHRRRLPPAAALVNP